MLADVSARTALSSPSILPSSRRLPAGPAMAVNVPVVSKKSTKNITKTIERNAGVASAEKSRLKAADDATGRAIIPENSARPSDQPITVMTMMEIRMPPLIPRASRPAIITSAISDRMTSLWLISPNPTIVSGLATIILAPVNPISARNRPIPAVMPI